MNKLIILLIVLFIFIISAGYVSADSDIDNLNITDLNNNITVDYNNDCLIPKDSNNTLKMSNIDDEQGINLENSNFHENSTITINSTNSNESYFFNDNPISVHVVFEGKKVYVMNDLYKIKILDENNNPVSDGEVTFFVY